MAGGLTSKRKELRPIVPNIKPRRADGHFVRECAAAALPGTGQ